MRFLAVLLLPLAEVAGFVLVGGVVGVWGVLGLVVLGGVAGALLIRRAGAAPAELREALRRGGDPGPVLLKGGVRLVAAFLLILPGFLSDLLALLLLLPVAQRALLRALARRGFGPRRAARAPRPTPPSGAPIDEAEWEELPAPKRPTHGGSGWTRH